ncbi:MAG: patatin-like phospholipase family protein [Nevskiales bacterium]
MNNQSHKNMQATTTVGANDDVLLSLQYLEQSLTRAALKAPHIISAKELLTLRYALRLAALNQFEPGAALGERGRGDISIAPSHLAALRDILLNEMAPRMARAKTPQKRLAAALRSLRSLEIEVINARQQLLAQHVNDFSPKELDAELANKKLILVAGGGGGAGYVYTGAMARLMAEGIAPSYIVGSSIGALQGAFWARDPQPDYQRFLEFTKTLLMADVFGTPRRKVDFTLPGVMRLHLQGVMQELANETGEPLRIRDLAIPYEAVVGGVQSRIWERIPGFLPTDKPKGRRDRIRSVLARSAWQLSTLITPNLLDEVVLGRDDHTQDFDVLEAIGFSAAIPGVIQFDPVERSERMQKALSTLCEQRQLTAIVDGGVVNNVPARVAWRGVQGGKIGTRNAYYLALDCFQPQLHRKHLLLWPVTQAVQLQMPANRSYFDWLQQFKPTLSPANFLPSPADLNQSWAWGWAQMEEALPQIKESMKPLDIRALSLASQPAKQTKSQGLAKKPLLKQINTTEHLHVS